MFSFNIRTEIDNNFCCNQFFRDWVQGFFCSFDSFIVWNIGVWGFLYLRWQYIYIYNIFRWRSYLPLKISFRLYCSDYNIYLPLKITKIPYFSDLKRMSPWIIWHLYIHLMLLITLAEEQRYIGIYTSSVSPSLMAFIPDPQTEYMNISSH